MGILPQATKCFFVIGEHGVELLLCFHVHGEGWSVGNGDDLWIGECACDGAVIECRAVPQQTVGVVICAAYDSRWELLLYVFDDVYVDAVVCKG